MVVDKKPSPSDMHSKWKDVHSPAHWFLIKDKKAIIKNSKSISVCSEHLIFLLLQKLNKRTKRRERQEERKREREREYNVVLQVTSLCPSTNHPIFLLHLLLFFWCFILSATSSQHTHFRSLSNDLPPLYTFL